MQEQFVTKSVRLPAVLVDQVERAIESDDAGESDFSKFTRKALREKVIRLTDTQTRKPRQRRAA